MRLIGDVNDKRPAEPGDLRIVGRKGEDWERFRIEQAQERSFPLRWLGLRWVPFVAEDSDRPYTFVSLNAARRTAEAMVRDCEARLARQLLDLQIEAATPVPCSWDGPQLPQDYSAGGLGISLPWPASVSAPSSIRDPWTISISPPPSTGAVVGTGKLAAAKGVRGWLFEARIICSGISREEAGAALRTLLSSIMGPKVDGPAALYSLRDIDPPKAPEP